MTINLIMAFGATLLFVILLFILLKVIKKYQSTNEGSIKIISARAIGSKEKIALIEVNEMQILIGVTPNQISKLSEMEKKTHTFNQTLDSKMKGIHNG